MSGEFYDTSIVVYLFDETSKERSGVAKRLIADGIASGTATISSQVVRETLNVMSMKLGATASECRQAFDLILAPLWRPTPPRPLYLRALDVRDRYRFSFYDSLIVAGALEAGCDRLLTEDLQHGQRIDGLTVHNPFL